MTFEKEHLTRQLDLIPLEVLTTPITVIGAGAIGGWTVLALAKMGFEDIRVFDFDTVAVENMNSQFYRFKDIGSPKVEALAQLVRDFTMVDIKPENRRYENEVFPGIVISAVDSMAARRQIWEAHKDQAPHTRVIIDPRMSAETALLYVMNPMSQVDQGHYEDTLYTDREAVQERCTAKATIYTANLLAGLTCKAVKDVLTRPDPLRVASWDIAENCFLGWKRELGYQAATA